MRGIVGGDGGGGGDDDDDDDDDGDDDDYVNVDFNKTLMFPSLTICNQNSFR